MNSQFIQHLGRLLNVYIELESMKTANKEREINGHALAYDENAFYALTNTVQDIVHEAGSFPY